ncbi:MAG: leucyl aminopeptidase [Alcanivorax sp.]|nr:leucyl aminopeptidase [Alcanivorax sp.]
MDYAVSNKAPALLKADCLVVALGKGATDLPDTLPEATRQLISACVKSGDFTGKKQQTLLLQQPPELTASRLLLVGTGVDGELGVQAFLQLTATVAKGVTETGARSAAWLLDNIAVKEHDTTWILREGSRGVADNTYRYDEYRSEKPSVPALKRFTFLTSAPAATAKQALAEGTAIAAGMALAKDLGNRPPNDCHPDYLVTVAKALVAEYPALKLKTISEKQAEKLGMGAFCSVARGSERDGQIMIFEYHGAKGAPVALVGKGITFDTGGISLKPGAGMDEMKYDMCGAASVFGTVKAVCEMQLPVNLVAVVVAAENMPDGRASRPGDIVRTLSGQTVEILNTDAEGRLVLCDALTYVQQKYKPSAVVDIATLTGACVVALGSHAQAVYANDAELAEELLLAGEDCGDRGWPMPLWDDYQEQLDSPFADMANIGGPKAGSITAACFLSRFTKDVSWAHLDIAGTAWVSGGKLKGATGRPVPMLTRYLMHRAGSGE